MVLKKIHASFVPLEFLVFVSRRNSFGVVLQVRDTSFYYNLRSMFFFNRGVNVAKIVFGPKQMMSTSQKYGGY